MNTIRRLTTLIALTCALALATAGCIAPGGQYSFGHSYGQPAATIHSVASGQLAQVWNAACRPDIVCMANLVRAHVTVPGPANGVWKEAWRGPPFLGQWDVYWVLEDLMFAAFISGRWNTHCMSLVKRAFPEYYQSPHYGVVQRTINWSSTRLGNRPPGGVCIAGTAY